MATRNRSAAASVPTPSAARWTVGVGGTISLGAAAAISFETLVRLADRLGITPGYLLPAAIDVYAATATLASLLLPAVHPARATAMWNARGGLAMSVLANAVYHGLVLGSIGGTDLVLIFISAWPPLIVERLLHLQGRLALPATGAASGAEAKPVAGRQREPVAAPAAASGSGNGAAANPAAGGSERAAAATANAGADRQRESGSGNVVPITGSGRRSAEDWAELALPLWRRHLQRHGTTPSAPELATALRHAHPALPVPQSDRSERNIRSATEALAKADDEPEREAS